MHDLENETATKFAVQTAVISLIVEELIRNKSIDREIIVKRLYDLLYHFSTTGERMHNAGSIKHLISLLEKPKQSHEPN